MTGVAVWSVATRVESDATHHIERHHFCSSHCILSCVYLSVTAHLVRQFKAYCAVFPFATDVVQC